MSYLLPAGTSPRTKNKWGLGTYGKRMMRSRGLSRWKLYQNTGGPGALGQDSTDIDFATGLPCDDPRANCGPPAPATPPSQPGVNPVVQAAYQNLLTQQQNSKNPLDYVSPQAAIAAGLPPQQVYDAWSTALARFPSQQAALNAGIPAGVVTQLWPQSRAAMPASSSNTFLGVPVTYLFGGGLAILAIAGLRGRR